RLGRSRRGHGSGRGGGARRRRRGHRDRLRQRGRRRDQPLVPAGVVVTAAGAPRPRLVATDLDGTLLDAAGTVTPRTREVITALDEMGVPVVFVTGRPMRWMEALWDAVGGHGLAICSNGGIVYDVPTQSVRKARAIPREVLLEVG